jgi:tetratricopeptide (TPR) repeat protein
MTNLAEIAWRRGKLDRAEQVYRQALSLNRRDAYLLDAFADFLLDRKRPDEVVRLLEKEPRADGHLLRLALARDALDEKKASSLIETLASRFAGNRLRSEALHLREQARFELSLRRRPAKALELALKNWRTQREPADARLVLKSALAADQLAKSRQVLDWLDRTGLEDPTLRTLADEIRNSHR